METETHVGRRLVDAANARDWDALLEVCSPDVTLIHPASPAPYSGRDGVREFFILSADSYPDQFLHVDALLTGDGIAALEGRITASEGDEQTVTPCAFFFTLRDGLIHQIRMYYDTASIDDEDAGY